MEHPAPRPDTINALRWGADAAFALLAGMQLDVFTPLQRGPLTVEQLAEALGVGPARLRLLLYALEPIPVGGCDDLLVAKILCHGSLFNEHRPRASTS